MTPTTLDWRSVCAKLRKINQLLDDLVSTSEVGPRRLKEDRVIRDAAERILTLIVDLAVSINTHVSTVEVGHASDTYTDSFSLVAKAGLIDRELADRLRFSAGLDYQRAVDKFPSIIEEYGRYVEQVARWLLDRQKVSGGT